MQTSRRLILVVAIAVATCPFLGAQRHPVSIPDLMNQEAASGSPASVHRYAADLVGLIVPDAAGKDYIDLMSERLAQAELKARKGEEKLIPETEVAAAYNELVQNIGAPASFDTSAEIIHRFRRHDIKVQADPALLTAGRNGDGCYPGEAVFLVYLLIENDGKLPQRVLDDQVARVQFEQHGGYSAHSFGSFQRYHGVGAMLFAYAEHHGRRSTGRLFNVAFRPLGF